MDDQSDSELDQSIRVETVLHDYMAPVVKCSLSDSELVSQGSIVTPILTSLLGLVQTLVTCSLWLNVLCLILLWSARVQL